MPVRPKVPVRIRTWSLLAAVALVAGLATPAGAVLPYGRPGPANPYDYPSYLFIQDGNCSPRSSELPADFDCVRDWKYTDHRDGPNTPEYDPLVANNPQELYGVKGVGTNRAWEVSTGRPDVVIAVLDSGIRWEEDRPELIDKYYLNRGELPVPEGGPNPDDDRFDGYDVTGDGVFNGLDYARDSRVSDLNDNGAIDPEDLIRTFSDGTDADDNGYRDDISGWDFFENDNNPQDDTDYGHGTGEAEDSTGEAGEGSDGQCPNCMMMPMRVGDSFIADVNHWAEAVIYAVDNGVSVVQEALGTLNHTSFGQAAADYAYENGVIINASEADEAAGHHNWPAAYDHTMVVNSIRTSGISPAGRPNSYLYFNGCTNFGGYTYVSIPSTSCSSEATGRSSGVSGLLYSAALNAVETGAMTRYIRDDGTRAPFALSAEEAMQLWRLSADDIDFSSPCPAHDFCDDAPAGAAPAAPPNNYGTTIPGSIRYQSVRGWDYFFGYGRSNAARLLRFVGGDGAKEYVPPGPYGVGDSLLTAQDRIPPEADISSPRRWRQYGYDPSTFELVLPDDPADRDAVVVHGRVAANRVTAEGGRFDWVLEWAPHVQGQKWPVSRPASGSEERSDGPWTVAASGRDLREAFEGELGRIDVRDLATALRNDANPFDPATDPTSEFQPERFGIRLRVRVIAHPVDQADTVNNEAVSQKQIDVYPARESVLREDTGVGGLPAGGAGSPSFHDLNGDGEDELLLPTEDGVIHAYTDLAAGRELPGWPVKTDPYPGIRTTGRNGYTNGKVSVTDVRGSVLLGSLAVADLDGDGTMEVSAGDLEGKLYVWEHDGSRRAGFPVRVDLDLSRERPCGPETIPACDDYEPGPPKRDARNDRDWGINSAPAVGDLDPSRRGLELVVGSNDGHVYAWHEDGSPVRGWPVILRDPEKVAAMDPTTRFVTYKPDAGDLRGTKVLVTPSLGDVDRDGDLEVVIGVNEEYEEDPNAELVTDPVLESNIGGSGNTRVYALHHEGAAHPGTPQTDATAHTQDQAYVDGWPVPIALLVVDLLPYVGEGTNTQAVLADVKGVADRDDQLEIAIASAAGPVYLLNHDGSSYYGTGPTGDYITMASSPGGPGSTSADFPSYLGVGALAIGSLDGGNHLSVAGPGAGLQRLLDVALPAHQPAAEDHLLSWNAATGRFEPNFPINVNDLQFFTEPIVADVSGDGLAEITQGTAMSDTVSAGLTSTSATATRFFTGGWHIAAAAVGTEEASGPLKLVTVTREGYLRAFPLDIRAGTNAACVAASQWPEYGHDAYNSGNYHTDAERPDPVVELEAQAQPGNGPTHVRFRAPGDDGSCGRAARYEVRRIDGHVDQPDWGDGSAVQIRETPGQPGSREVLQIQLASGRHTLMVRAVDEAGNGSAVRSVQVTVP
ncbi:MAG TPA: S8 family serine peptidase [Actinomycetota bacterium]|nr:S8 family serine peptidase [Actinomycetota bacterium]